MNLIVALFLSVTVAATGETMSIVSNLRFETVEQCENFVKRMSQDYPYYRDEETNALVFTVPQNGNILTAKCYKR